MSPSVLIQCRSASTRLPGKALLPVRGMPAVVLCAKRAANTGLDVKILTSNDPSDDVLCETLDKHSVPYFRGSLEDVLDRFCSALDNHPEDTLVVRLTADNLFVDGALIEESLQTFQKDNKRHYLSLHPPILTGTPYGLSLEIFSISALRAANKAATCDSDREHVTPWIVRKYGVQTYRPADLRSNQGHLRCTMDSWGDYQRILKIFRKTSNPVLATWQELCEHLHAISPHYGVPGVIKNGMSIGTLSMGTAQIGLSYGIKNTEGELPSVKAKELVVRAIDHGITHFDCASAYGVAERRLGNILSKDYHSRAVVTTKLSPLANLPEKMGEKEITAFVESSVYRSCVHLNLRSLPYLLLHRWQHRRSHHGLIWKVLRQLQQEGVIEKLGSSVQNPDEAIEAIHDPDISFIQLPFNMLDSRLQKAGFLNELSKRDDVIIQARSVFLQGLLLTSHNNWPAIEQIDSADIRRCLFSFVKEFGRDGVDDLCVAYVRAQPWVDCLVIGMETIQQLDRNVRLFQTAPLKKEECIRIEKAFYDMPERLLNPALWEK